MSARRCRPRRTRACSATTRSTRAPTSTTRVNPANQNGVVFFPGQSPLYKDGVLVGGLGVSGDGVDQDDVVSFFASQGFQPPTNLQVDNYTYNGVALPYQNFNRNPQN